MPKRKRRRFKKSALDYIALPRLNLDPDTKKGIFIVLILALGAISLLSLFNLSGSMGVYLAKAMTLMFGWGKWLFPIILLALGFFLYNDDKYEIRGMNYFGLFIFVISFHGLLHLFIGQEQWKEAVSRGEGGGYIGLLFASNFVQIMGFWAGLIVLICLLLISLMLMFNTNLWALIGRGSWLSKLLFPVNFVFAKIFKRGREKHKIGEKDINEESFFAGKEKENNEEEDDEDEDDNESEEDDEQSFFTETAEGKDKDLFSEALAGGEAKFFSRKIKSDPVIEDPIWQPTNINIDLPLNLLNGRAGKPTSGDIKANTIIIQKTLENFGIPVEMGGVSVGPTVTQYTLKPAEGIKLSRITALNNDLSLSMAAHPIRIEAPIPGKSLVGIEVPNQIKAIVALKEILLSNDFKNRKSDLTIALGKDVSGKAWIDDLGKMPHLLVAGTTGAGKSVMLNSIIVSLLYQNNPDDVRFIMVDPKRVELPVYNGIPYLLTPVITEVNKTINALKWCLNEMDRRFEILSKSGRRDIGSYNKSNKHKMPYIIFIIDELADLMVVAARDIEAGVIRLAQMARAVGIHLVLATQRPSVDVITGLIKANMPARIAFSVASSIDSRTILDAKGAEKLLGRGDMLFATAEMSKPKRIQGAFVSDQEIKKIVSYIKERGEPDYDESIVEKQKVYGIAGVGLDKGDGDELFEEAKEIVINTGKASASLLQRRLRIGYARAARLIDLLEDAGIVGPADGAKPREILINAEQYDNMISQEHGVSGVSLHDQESAEEPDEYLDNGEEDDEDEDMPMDANLGLPDSLPDRCREADQETPKKDEGIPSSANPLTGEILRDKDKEDKNYNAENKNNITDMPSDVKKKIEMNNENKNDDDDDDDEGKYFSR